MIENCLASLITTDNSRSDCSAQRYQSESASPLISWFTVDTMLQLSYLTKIFI